MALRTTAELPRGLYPDFQIEIQIEIQIETGIEEEPGVRRQKPAASSQNERPKERGVEPGKITAIHGLGLYPDFQIEIQIQIETSKAEIVLDADFDQDPPDGKAFYRLSTE